MKIYSTSQIKDLDRYTIEKEPIVSINLMERASVAFVKVFRTYFPDLKQVVILAGPGNNGGDALAIARILSEMRCPVEVYLYHFGKTLSADCEFNRARLLENTGILLKENESSVFLASLPEDCVIIDGLFGSGLNKPLKGAFVELVKQINQSCAKVVSIDIPSGLFGEDNAMNNPENIVRSDLTLTFQSPKLSFFFAENERYVPAWEVLDIGIHPEILRETFTPFHLTEKRDIAGMLKKRNRFDHKGIFGHALLIAGSCGKMGAAVLAAKACLRTGAGLLTVHVPSKGGDILQNSVPEAMLSVDKEACFFTESPGLDRFDALGVGPGIGTGADTKDAFLCLLKQVLLPLVLDADALNILSSVPDFRNLIPMNSILTPHPKEFDRLAGHSVSSFERLRKALDLAEQLQSYVVLKGAYTAVCTPGGLCYFNSTGNPGMATAGSGDVLTGIILSLLSQGYEPKEAAMIGTYIHGMAGDQQIESGNQSQESLLAGDLVTAIGSCFRELRKM